METDIPRDYLYKLVPALSEPGLVSVRRGKHGGLQLRRDPETISIFDVLCAVEPWNRLDGCPLSNRDRCARTGTSGKLCGLHEAMDQVADSVERRLKSIRLADFMREGTVSLRLPSDKLSTRAVARPKRVARPGKR